MSMVAGGGGMDAAAPGISKRDIFFCCKGCGARTGDSVSEARQKQQYITKVCQITKTAHFIPSIQPLVCLCLEIYSTCACVELPLSSPTRIWSCCHHCCACEAYSTVCSFIIVSSSNPTGLMISNKPYFLKAFWLYC